MRGYTQEIHNLRVPVVEDHVQEHKVSLRTFTTKPVCVTILLKILHVASNFLCLLKKKDYGFEF